MAQRHHLRPGDAGEARYAGDADGDQRRALAAAEHRDQSHGEENVRQCEQHVDAAHQQRVAPVAIEAGDQSDRDADQRRDQDGAEGGDQRGAGAIDDAGEDVAAELVSAKPGLGGGRLQRIRDALCQRIERQEAGEDRGQRDQGQEG
jgi:hypothetical protein